MEQYNNIIVDFTGKENYQDEYNIEVISVNLDDFNSRFGTDIKLTYKAEDFLYHTSTTPSKLGDYFLSNINYLLFLAHNPSNDDLSFCDEYISWLVSTVNDKEVFKIWFTDYTPLGMNLTDEVKDYVKSKLNNLCVSM